MAKSDSCPRCLTHSLQSTWSMSIYSGMNTEHKDHNETAMNFTELGWGTEASYRSTYCLYYSIQAKINHTKFQGFIREEIWTPTECGKILYQKDILHESSCFPTLKIKRLEIHIAEKWTMEKVFCPQVKVKTLHPLSSSDSQFPARLSGEKINIDSCQPITEAAYHFQSLFSISVPSAVDI